MLAAHGLVFEWVHEHGSQWWLSRSSSSTPGVAGGYAIFPLEYTGWITINSFSHSFPVHKTGAPPEDTAKHRQCGTPQYSVMRHTELRFLLLTMPPIFGMSRYRSRVWNFWLSSWNSSICLFLVCMTFCNGKGGRGGKGVGGWDLEFSQAENQNFATGQNLATFKEFITM